MTHQNALSMQSDHQQVEEQQQKRVVEAIKREIQRITNYTPKVGIFGDTGNGKSSLGNALFGQKVAKVGDIEACTREPQEIFLSAANGEAGIKLLDVPGIGEDQDRHDEYIALYKSLLPELDLVIWTLRADVRSDLSALNAFQEVIASNKNAPPVVFALTQVDKIKPHREWNDAENMPGLNQMAMINEKIISVSNKFDIPTNRIIPISSEEGYNLVSLVDLMVELLPNEKKYSVTREAKEEIVSEQATEQAAQGIMDRVKEIAGAGWDWVKDEGTELALRAAVVLIPRVANKIAKFLRGIF